MLPSPPLRCAIVLLLVVQISDCSLVMTHRGECVCMCGVFVHVSGEYICECVCVGGSAWTKPVNLPSSFLRMSTPQMTSIQVTRLVLCTHWVAGVSELCLEVECWLVLLACSLRWGRVENWQDLQEEEFSSGCSWWGLPSEKMTYTWRRHCSPPCWVGISFSFWKTEFRCPPEVQCWAWDGS